MLQKYIFVLMFFLIMPLHAQTIKLAAQVGTSGQIPKGIGKHYCVQWQDYATYSQDDFVIYLGTVYHAKQIVYACAGCNQNPVINNVAWENGEWKAETPYPPSTYIWYRNEVYKSKWWTQDENPAVDISGAWVKLNACTKN